MWLYSILQRYKLKAIHNILSVLNISNKAVFSMSNLPACEKNIVVRRAEEWEFSSAKDYSGLRAGKLVNKGVAEKYVNW